MRFGIRYLAFVSWHLLFSIHCLFCIKLNLKLTNLCRFDEWRSVGHHTALLSSFLMASRNDGDLKDKGRTLWDALKNKNIDRVERNSVIRELLQKGCAGKFQGTRTGEKTL